MDRLRLIGLGLAVAVGSSACGGAPSAPARASSAPDEGDDFESPADRVRAFMDNEDLFLSQGDFSGVATMMTPDVFWFGRRAEQVVVGRPAVAGGLRAEFGDPSGAGSTATFVTPFQAVGVAPGGRSVWVTEEMPGTGEGPDGPAEVPYRVTSLVVRDGSRWFVAAQHWSVGTGTPAGRGSVEPAPVPAEVGAGARPLVEALEDAVDDPGSFSGAVADHPDVMLIGPAADDRAEGAEAVRSWLRVRLADAEWEVRGDVRASLAPDGATGFTAANLAAGDRVLRGLIVWIREGEDWRIAQAHLSEPSSD
jgi:ketosteroid isomerase-like protein